MRNKSIISIIILAVIAFVCWAKSRNDEPREIDGRGNPVENRQKKPAGSHYTESLELARTSAELEEQIVAHTGYTVSWNCHLNIPNWVAYELTESEVAGDEDRSNSFIADPDVPDCPISKDYSNSGYDRGHMAPAADMKWSEQAMTESFYLTNICPQNHNLNSGDWLRLEEHVRRLAEECESVTICVGPIVKNAHPMRIGKVHKIVVPDAFFKVLLIYRDGDWQALGFRMDNCPRNGRKTLSDYACTVDELEAETGHDFFYNLPDSVEQRIEAERPLMMFDL